MSKRKSKTYWGFDGTFSVVIRNPTLKKALIWLKGGQKYVDRIHKAHHQKVTQEVHRMKPWIDVLPSKEACIEKVRDNWRSQEAFIRNFNLEHPPEDLTEP